MVQVVRNSESDTYTLADIARHSAAVDPLAFKNSTSTQYQVMSSPRSRIMVLAAGADEWLPVGRLWHDSGASPCVMATAYASKMELLVQPSKTQLTFADAHQGKGAMELVDGLSMVFNPDQPEVKVHIHLPCFVIETAGFDLLMGNAAMHVIGGFVDPYASRLYYRPRLHMGDASVVGSLAVRTTTQWRSDVMLCMMMTRTPTRRIRLQAEPRVIQIAPMLDITNLPAGRPRWTGDLEPRTPLVPDHVTPDLVEWEFGEDSSEHSSDTGTDTDTSDPVIVSAYAAEIQQRVQQHQAAVGRPPEGERYVVDSQDVLRCVVRVQKM